MTDLGQSGVEGAIEKVVGILDRDDPGQARLFRGGEKLHGSPRSFVREADVANLSLRDEIAEHLQRLLDGDGILMLRRRVIAAAEQGHGAVRPM